MTVELFLDDLELAATSVHNARIAYQQIVNAIKLGCEVNLVFTPLYDVPEDRLEAQIRLLKNITNQLDAAVHLKDSTNVSGDS